MGYYTNFDGAIRIEPPLTWAEIKDSPWLPDAVANSYADVKLRVTEETIEAEDGTLTRKSADAIVPVTDEAYKGYDIIETVQKVIDAYPGHEFTGRFDCEGEQNADIWRLVIRERRAVRIDAQIVWPEGSE